MPEDSRKVYATHVGRVTKVIAAPIAYVYDWCTDYRADDGQYSRSKPRFRVLELRPDRVVRVRYSSPKTKPFAVAVEVVRLRPPNAWHLDQIDESDFNSVDYKLTRLGPKKTRLSITLVERWMVPTYPARSEWVRRASTFWDGLAAAMEASFREGLPARG